MTETINPEQPVTNEDLAWAKAVDDVTRPIIEGYLHDPTSVDSEQMNAALLLAESIGGIEVNTAQQSRTKRTFVSPSLWDNK